MGELVIFLASFGGRSRWLVFVFRVGRGDEPDFTVENADQVIEIFRTTGIARRLQQFGMGPHVALDVCPGFGEQRFEDSPRRLLVIAVFGWSGGGTERL